MNASQAQTKALDLAAEWLYTYLEKGRIKEDCSGMLGKDIDRVEAQFQKIANALEKRFHQRQNSGKLIDKGRGRPPKTRKGFARGDWEIKRLREQWELLKPKREGKIFIIEGYQIITNLSHKDLRFMVTRAECSWPDWEIGEWGGKIE